MVHTKAIIIAAGRGQRMGALTDSRPKCLLEVGGRSLLQRQLDAFEEHGVAPVVVVRGYQKGLIDLDGLRYVDNPDFASTNILCSLMTARREMDGAFIASYSDIVYRPEVVGRLMETPGDIVCVVDMDWRGRYVGRTDHPEAEAENAVVREGRITQVGKAVGADGDVGEFIGMVRFSAAGRQRLLQYWDQVEPQGPDEPFMRAPRLRQAYLTDMLQFMIDQGEEVRAAEIQGGWDEIDTPGDLQRAQQGVFP